MEFAGPRDGFGEFGGLGRDGRSPRPTPVPTSIYPVLIQRFEQRSRSPCTCKITLRPRTTMGVRCGKVSPQGLVGERVEVRAFWIRRRCTGLLIMRRRHFLAMMGGAVAMHPLVTRAQP